MNTEIKNENNKSTVKESGDLGIDLDRFNQDNDLRDEGDIASAIEMEFTANAIKQQQAKNAPETHPDFDGEHCIDCDIVIPAARLALNKIRCVTCQGILEQKNKLYGR